MASERNRERREIIKTLALAIAVGVPVFVAASLICVWVSDANECEQMICEILAMKRPHSDASNCQAWFHLFR